MFNKDVNIIKRLLDFKTPVENKRHFEIEKVGEYIIQLELNSSAIIWLIWSET